MTKKLEIKKIIWAVAAGVLFFSLIFGKSIYQIFQGDISIPATFNFFGLVGHYYGLVLFFSLLFGYLVARRLAALEKINLDKYIGNLFLGFIIALFFARLTYVVFQTDKIESFWQIFATWQGGMSIHGAVFGIVLYLWYLARKYQINFAQFADFLAPALILGQAIGRWGNFINQEAYGPATSLPWKMFVSPGRRFLDLVDKSFYHPTFLYESIGDLAIFFLLLYLYSMNKKTGNIAIIYVIGYSILRFAVEFWRIDRVMWGLLSPAQWASIVLILTGLYLLFARNQPKHVEEF